MANEGIAYDPNVQIGGMIEIPAAALALNVFIKKLDFLSIGTNDLIQYTLAIDRTDDEVAHLYDPLHPAVMQLLAHVIGSANKAGVPISVCGEMAGELAYTRLLLGLGLAPILHAPGAIAGHQAARAHHQPAGDGAARTKDNACRRSDEDTRSTGSVEHSVMPVWI